MIYLEVLPYNKHSMKTHASGHRFFVTVRGGWIDRLMVMLMYMCICVKVENKVYPINIS